MFENLTFIQLISNLGFPIAITVYLLHRFEKRIKALEKAVNDLAKLIESSRD
ncbi:YvrJ family protein [Sediminibacillus dalangtanensis]|uniref:YvrJ family protein n=1 Tax=Sediminibacillus dalangtanensis TaxID=2729421 RepID=A0ABX7VXN6_9BACI|nr:YvrJ family protein [Sediminibacillus dalangtanensis]QTN01329.1 YvrJ family protein [Sediminibacillus dalangtanensis]